MITRKVPYRCPVCGGNGIVAAGFYTQTSGCWTSTGGFEMCRSCNGTGIIYGEEITTNDLVADYDPVEENIQFY